MYVMLGDMLVTGEKVPPAKLMKALAVLADGLHRSFDRNPTLRPSASRESCVLASLAVNDFLNGIGIAAQVRPVMFLVRASQQGQELHSLGIGFEDDDRVLPGRWKGHMVVTAGDWLIDSTLYPAVDRPAWRGCLKPMIAIEMSPNETAREIWGKNPLASAFVGEGDYELIAMWLDNPDNTRWTMGPDARDEVRRIKVVKRLIRRFGQWVD